MKHPPEHYEKERQRDKKRWAAKTAEQKLDTIYRRYYGLTYNQVKEMYDEQTGRCASCFDPIVLGRGKGVVDHCHDTGVVRGVLCAHCNTALGQLKDSKRRVKQLLQYCETYGVRDDTRA